MSTAYKDVVQKYHDRISVQFLARYVAQMADIEPPWCYKRLGPDVIYLVSDTESVGKGK